MGKLLHSLPTAGDWVQHLEFLPDGTGLVAAGSAGVIHVWDTKTGTTRAHTTGHTSGVRGVQFTPDGGAVTASADGLVIVWDAAGKEIRRFVASERGISSLALSRDGKTAFTSGVVNDGTARAWDVEKGTELRKYLPASETLSSGAEAVVLSPDGKTLAAGFVGKGLYLLDAATFAHTATLKKPSPGSGWTTVIGFATGGRVVSREIASAVFLVWDTGKDVAPRQIKGAAPDPLALVGMRVWSGLAVSPDGKQFAAPHRTGPLDRAARLGVWNVESGNLAESFELTKAAALTAVAYLPDGNTVAVGDMDGKVWLVDVATKAVPRVLDGHRGAVTCLAVSADGKTLASGSADTTAIIWNLVKP